MADTDVGSGLGSTALEQVRLTEKENEKDSGRASAAIGVDDGNGKTRDRDDNAGREEKAAVMIQARVRGNNARMRGGTNSDDVNDESGDLCTIRAAFNEFDASGDGSIDAKEFQGRFIFVCISNFVSLYLQ